jgi:hypothetical protein
MPSTPVLDVIAPGMILISLGLGLIALCLLTLLITIVEGVVLALLKWNVFPRSLVASFIMNVTSSLVGGLLLIILQDIPLTWMILAFLLSVGIEGAILLKIQPAVGRRTWLLALAANLASYLLLILPAYLFSLAD